MRRDGLYIAHVTLADSQVIGMHQEVSISNGGIMAQHWYIGRKPHETGGDWPASMPASKWLRRIKSTTASA